MIIIIFLNRLSALFDFHNLFCRSIITYTGHEYRKLSLELYINLK